MAKPLKRGVPRSVWVVLLLAFALRLALAVATKGYAYDVSCFTAWAQRLAQTGTAGFYAPDYFADYPPGYLLVLLLVGRLAAVLGAAAGTALLSLLLCMVPAVCDCLAALLIYRTGGENLGPEAQSRLTWFVAFCPVLLFDTGIWKQIDGVFALPLMLCFALLEKRRPLPAALCYGIALAIKPQALMAGPVMAVCFLADVFAQADFADRVKAIGRIFAGAALALLPPTAAGLPFFGWRNLLPGLVEKYTETAQSYPYASVNGFNWFAALGGNWADQSGTVFGNLTWQTLGSVNLLLLTAVTAVLAAMAFRRHRFSPVLLAAFYMVGVFTLAQRMHERYLIAGTLLTLLAAARWNDKRLLAAGAGLSLTGFLNLAAIYALAGTDDEWLTSDTSALFLRVVSFAETICFLLLAYAVYRIVRYGEILPIDGAGAPDTKKVCTAPCCRLAAVPAAQLLWTKREFGGLALLTVLTAVVSFAYLGELSAPQNPLDATGKTVTTEFQLAGDAVPATLWIYPGISTGGSITVRSAQTGEILLAKDLDYTTTFCWVSMEFAHTAQSYTVTVENASVFELALHTAGGDLVPVAGGDALFDEQNAVPRTISQLNSMYFDEIYHGRTGYEMLHGLTVYETTHPPLGKDFIMLGIALFGMTGFGWRFSGTLFGVLLVPLIYCFVRRLTRKTFAAAAAAILLALDFMRFVQSRIATIDIYGTFFILLGAYFLLWYGQSVLTKGVANSLLPMALGGAAFGLGCASKWTGIYAGAGLAVLYFGILYARWRQHPPEFRREFAIAACGGAVFYIGLPLLIYLAAYLPYLWHDPSFSLSDWWNCQTYMYWYHSTLEATHPFESRWYTWPLNLRPVWYYENVLLPAGKYGSIAGMGGPVVWLGGAAAILTLAWHHLTGRGTRASGAVLVLYGAQLVPWVLVTRCTFLYHYFPSSIFGLVAMALLIAQMREGDHARRIAFALCGVSLVLFVWFYPVLSGLPVSGVWAASLKWLPSWGFYNLI